MTNTERLYYRDAELLTYDARVIGHHDGNPQQVLLDRTAFYPTSGGQPHDLGTINGVAVTNVVDEGDTIVHHTAQPVMLGVAECVIDSTRRHDHMQQHTAQHLISALAADRLQWATTSVHFGIDGSTIEFETPVASAAQLDALELWSNQAVKAAQQVSVTFEDAATAEGLRAPPKRDGELRIITIAGLDRSACGGTHVAHTGEIGPVRLTGVEKIRGNIRVGFVAGDRTMQRLRSQDALLVMLATEMGCAISELSKLLPRRLAELQDVRTRLEIAEGAASLARLLPLVEAATVATDGIRRIEYQGSSGELRMMAQHVVAMRQVVFVGSETPTGVLVIATSADSGVDAGARLKSVLTILGGKGGGSPRIAQGSVPPDQLAVALAAIVAK